MKAWKFISAIALLSAAIAIYLGVFASKPHQLVLPDDLAIAPLRDDIPKHIAAYHGAWHGYWPNGDYILMVTTKMSAESAEILWAWNQSSSVDVAGKLTKYPANYKYTFISAHDINEKMVFPNGYSNSPVVWEVSKHPHNEHALLLTHVNQHSQKYEATLLKLDLAQLGI